MGILVSPLLSIIVPTRNRCHIFPDTLDSIFAQSSNDIQVILSNNFSSDNTKAVATRYFKYPNFHYIEHTSLLNPAKHWDKILTDFVYTRYAMILPDDDKLYHPFFIANALSILQDNPEIKLIFGDYQRFGSDNLTISPRIPKSGTFHDLFLKLKSNRYGVHGFGIPQLTAIFDTQMALKCSGFKYNCTSPDFLFWLSYLSHFTNKHYFHITVIASKYFVHKASLSNTYNLHSIFSDAYSVYLEIFNIPYVTILKKSGFKAAFQMCCKSIALFYYMSKCSLKRFVDTRISPLLPQFPLIHK